MALPNPKKIIFLITDSGVGGTEKVLLSLLKGLDRQRFDPRAVLVLKQKREMASAWEKTGVAVQSFGMNRWPSPLLHKRILSVIKRENPDIVHAFLFHSIQVARLIHVMAPSFSLVSSPRVNYKFAPQSALWLDRLLRNQDALTLCESAAGKQSLVKLHNYAESKIKVAWTSVDPNRFCFDPAARARIRKEWGVSEDEVLIGSVGRLHQQKGYDLLVRSLNSLDGVRGSFKAVVVGSGPEKMALEDLALTQSAPIRFVGERSDIPAVLSAFDIYVQSSRYEGLSNALLEAMSVGLPCVATAVDGTLDFAKDGQNLLLVRPEDPHSLALALGTLIEKPALRGSLSEHAKMTAATFSQERMIQGFEEAYQNVDSLS